MKRRLRWDSHDQYRVLPKHPYRDSAILYAVLAIVVVLVAVVTGGGIGRAIVFAAVVFVVATAWSWRTWRNRLREESVRRSEPPR